MIYNLLYVVLKTIWFLHGLTKVHLKAKSRPMGYIPLCPLTSHCKNPILEDTDKIPHYMSLFVNGIDF